jgi:ABC-type polysaccharide/polyol phosphate transport system ATPase subunit
MKENEPDIMIDEVTIYIDERFTEKIKTEILELAQYEYEDCYQMYGWD